MRDLRDDARALRRVGRGRRDLHPAPAEPGAADEARAAEEPRRAVGVADDVRPAVGAVVAREVLDADESRLGSRMLPEPPLILATEDEPVTGHPPVEGVRAQEREVTATVAISRDEVELVLGDVLVVTREDEQVVSSRERPGVGDTVEVDVRQEVRPVLALLEPA